MKKNNVKAHCLWSLTNLAVLRKNQKFAWTREPKLAY